MTQANTGSNYHRPVLLAESLDLLNIDPAGTYVDVTFGGGGHSSAILAKLGPEGRLFAFDKDADAHENRIEDPRFTLIRKDFRFIEKALAELNVDAVDGILADLGISSHHIDAPERGFAFRFDAPLDMRMDQDQELSAANVLNEYREERLVKIFWEYGEVKSSRRLAKMVVEARPLKTTFDLVRLVEQIAPGKQRAKLLAMVFQAIRIEVNRELSSLEILLEASLSLLRPGGRLAVIAYHSLEDRMVKRFFRFGNLEFEDRRDFYGNPLNDWKLITRKAVMPSEAEINTNPRARSARLRTAER